MSGAGAGAGKAVTAEAGSEKTVTKATVAIRSLFMMTLR
jgi:preprotein translocase subunit SecG